MSDKGGDVKSADKAAIEKGIKNLALEETQGSSSKQQAGSAGGNSSQHGKASFTYI